MSTPEQESAVARKCAGEGCKAPIRKGTTPVICSGCSAAFHKIHSGLQRSEYEALLARDSYEWLCSKCESIEKTLQDVVTAAQPVGTEISEPTTSTTRDGLRILQWNADGLTRKTTELQERLVATSIDVCFIQESKLAKNNRTPSMKGYTPYRADRANTKGGGLLAYVKNDLDFQKIGNRAKSATEVSSLRVRIGKSTWIDLNNVYAPPSHSIGQEIIFCPDIIPVSANSITCGDFNAHSKTWDLLQPEDRRGEEVETWMADKEQIPINTASVPTRHNRATGNGSSPDITVCGSNWSGRCSWSVQECIGGSDHLPILITVSTKIHYQPVLGKKPRWRIKGVDWDKFQAAVEDATDRLDPSLPIKGRVEKFTSLLTDAAKQHVGKVKIGKRSKSWMNPAIRTAIRKRNKLRRRLRTREERQAWLNACREVNNEIQASKTESWRNLLEDALASDDESKMWRIIKDLNGSPEDNAPNEAMVIGGRIITSNKKKADAFARHYAAVSRLQFTKEEREENRRLKKLLESPSVGDTSCSDFTMAELKKAISKMKRKGAAGPDEIPPSFLKALGTKALSELLAIFNLSFSTGNSPQEWRTALIVPILKHGKSASDLASFRPISLTSCIGKLFERMLAVRIYHIAESNGLLNSQQAGFRKGRSCEDQIIRITQAIEDGFQMKPTQRSVMVLLDFSKAYDTVWRQRLLLTMHQKGVPLQILRWLFGFLQNRQARVLYNGCTSQSVDMRQGLPQGSVLSPLLFLFVMDTLTGILPKDTTNALFADDVGILATAPSIKAAETLAQKTVDVVVEWSKRNHLTLNSSKSESCMFSTHRKEARETVSISIDNATIPFNPTPKFLGVHLDRELTFVKHVTEIAARCKAKLRMLSALTHTTWGCLKQDLMKVYIGHIRSVMDYAAPGWQPWLAATNLNALEVVQNEALRIISGNVRKSRLAARRRETETPSYATLSKRIILQSVKKAERMPDDHPRKLALSANPVPRKNQRKSWRQVGLDLANCYRPDAEYEGLPLAACTRAPWDSPNNLTVHEAVPGISSKADDAVTMREATLARIRDLNSSVVIYTDGSASAGTSDGGAGVVVTCGDPADPQITQTIAVKGAPRTSSYEEEVCAMNAALDYVRTNCQEDHVTICTDSLSLCQALVSLNEDVDPTLWRVSQCRSPIVVQWVPAHCGVPGNEAADQTAKDATTLADDCRPVSYASECARIRHAIQDPPPTDPADIRIAEIYSGYSRARDEAEVSTQKEQIDIARLRARTHPSLRAYQKKLNPLADATCPRCGHGDEDLEHWLFECPAMSSMKMKTFGNCVLESNILTLMPGKSLELAGASILRTSGSPGSESC